MIPPKHQDYKCPYSRLELRRPCEVSSCSYNLPDTEANRCHNRCFLYYADTVRKKPGVGKNEHDFNVFSQDKKNKITAQFFGITVEEVTKVTADFYMSLFSVFAEDVTVSLKKHQLDPVAHKQCAVCGTEMDELYCPPGVLPSGFGYCSYSCLQLKPPPILSIELNMDLDFAEFVSTMEHESHITRTKFIRQLIEWVVGSMPLRL